MVRGEDEAVGTLEQRFAAQRGEVEQLQAAGPEDARRLRARMGGSYGYALGYVVHGAYQNTLNLRRSTFAVLADAPGPSLPGHQSDNHDGQGQNALFEDGRVAFLASSTVDDGDDIFCNDAGQITAGLRPDDSVIVPSPTPPIYSVNYCGEDMDLDK